MAPLVAAVVEANAECDDWDARGAWSSVPPEVVQASLDADRALIAWVNDRAPDILEAAGFAAPAPNPPCCALCGRYLHYVNVRDCVFEGCPNG